MVPASDALVEAQLIQFAFVSLSSSSSQQKASSQLDRVKKLLQSIMPFAPGPWWRASNHCACLPASQPASQPASRPSDRPTDRPSGCRAPKRASLGASRFPMKKQVKSRSSSQVNLVVVADERNRSETRRRKKKIACLGQLFATD